MSTTFSYDTIEYPSKFFLQTHPDRFATAAQLYGMDSAPVESCRVLELGCGNGSNLIWQAYGLPDSEFVGIDLSQKHIEKASAWAADLGLKNLKFRQMDLMELGAEDFGPFDYISAHGLISWVPDFVAKKVPCLFDELLSAKGIGYVSFTAYPGAYTREMVRSVIRYHTDGIENPVEKVQKAMAFLTLLARNSGESKVYGHVLNAELERHAEHSVADIFHDDLSNVYQPFYIYQLAEKYGQYGLQFLAEAEIHASSRQGLSEEVNALLDSIESSVEREQYLDFFRGRIFRQSFFCRSEIQLDRQPQPSILDNFYLSSGLKPKEKISDITRRKVETFVSVKNQALEIDHQLTKASLSHLGKIWGLSIRTPDLLEAAKHRLMSAGSIETDWDEQFDTTRHILMQICLSSDLIEMHVYAPEAKTTPDDRPRVNRMARLHLGEGNNVITLLNKFLKINDPVARHLLDILDGSIDKPAIVEEMRNFVSKNETERDRDELIENMPNWVDDSLLQLARLGVFE